MAKKAPGKAHREGISLIDLARMFPDEAAATAWFESQIWPTERHCPRCGGVDTNETPARKPMPYWCRDCKKHFSVRTGSALERSKVPLQKWAFAIYLHLTNLKGVSSMKLHRDIDVTQKTAWFMLQRIREVWTREQAESFAGPVEVDETYIGGKRKNMPASKRKRLTGRGAVDKIAVIGAKDRETKKVTARAIKRTNHEVFHGFVHDVTDPDATVYTDEAAAYRGIKRNHAAVCHSVGEYVRDMAHTNGIESFWAMLKRGHDGIYHKISPKHLNRYVSEFAGRHNIRDADTLDQMTAVVAGMVGKRLTYADLIA